jgi:hypothetical protein
MKPYQKYAASKMIEMNGKSNFIKELENTIRELSEYPSDNLHQLIFFCGVLRYLKSI